MSDHSVCVSWPRAMRLSNEHHPRVRQAQAEALADELERLVAALRAGMDPELAVTATRDVQRKPAAAKHTVDEWLSEGTALASLDETEIAAALTRVGGFAALLETATREDRADLYTALGICVEHVVTGEAESARVSLELISGGGPICALTATFEI